MFPDACDRALVQESGLNRPVAALQGLGELISGDCQGIGAEGGPAVVLKGGERWKSPETAEAARVAEEEFSYLRAGVGDGPGGVDMKCDWGRSTTPPRPFPKRGGRKEELAGHAEGNERRGRNRQLAEDGELLAAAAELSDGGAL